MPPLMLPFDAAAPWRLYEESCYHYWFVAILRRRIIIIRYATLRFAMSAQPPSSLKEMPYCRAMSAD